MKVTMFIMIYKNLSLKGYLNKTKPYWRDIISNLQKSGTCRVQLTIAINSISPKNVDKELAMDSNSDKTEFKTLRNVNISDELFMSIFSRYQNDLETSRAGSDFIFDSVQLLYYKCQKKNFRHCDSYTYSPD